MNKNRMTAKPIALNDLMLDPNNPRFVQQFAIPKHFSDDTIEDEQINTIRHFTRDSNRSEHDEIFDGEPTGSSDEFFNVEDLCLSMSDIGFVPIDRVVVRKIKDSDKYLVIEGNRRIAAAKKLLVESENQKNPEKRLSAKIMNSLETISTLVFSTDGMNQDEINHELTVILGLRHYGSVMEWDPLPKAYNIFREYKGVEPRMDYFQYEPLRARKVASRLSVKYPDVRKACLTYSAYRQLSETFDGVQPKHYSLIEAAVTKKTLTGAGGYFVIDPKSLTMDEQSLTWMNDLCQFKERDNQSHTDIIPEPRHFKYLANLVKDRSYHKVEAVQKHATGLLIEVESGVLTAESAADALNLFIDQKEWATALGTELDKQQNELTIDSFEPIGFELTYLKDVTDIYEHLRRALEL